MSRVQKTLRRPNEHTSTAVKSNTRGSCINRTSANVTPERTTAENTGSGYESHFLSLTAQTWYWRLMLPGPRSKAAAKESTASHLTPCFSVLWHSFQHLGEWPGSQGLSVPDSVTGVGSTPLAWRLPLALSLPNSEHKRSGKTSCVQVQHFAYKNKGVKDT
jgi:hypothetical protein